MIAACAVPCVVLPIHACSTNGTRQMPRRRGVGASARSEEHTSELRHVSISYAVFCLKKKNKHKHHEVQTRATAALKQDLPTHQPLDFIHLVINTHCYILYKAQCQVFIAHVVYPHVMHL